MIKRATPDAWLARRLRGGPVPFLTLITEWCAESRVSVSTARKALGRAKDRLSVESVVGSYPAVATWRLPHWVTAKPASPAPPVARTPAPPSLTAPQAAPAPAPPLTAPQPAPKPSDGGIVAVATSPDPRGLHPVQGSGAGVTVPSPSAPPTARAVALPARVPPPAQRTAAPPPLAQRVPSPLPEPEPEPAPISDRAHWLSRYFRLPPFILDFGELTHRQASGECLFCEVVSNFMYGSIPVCPTCARATSEGRPPRTRAEADRIRALGGGLIGGGEYQTGR